MYYILLAKALNEMIREEEKGQAYTSKRLIKKIEAAEEFKRSS